jgi:hypothetical protein
MAFTFTSGAMVLAAQVYCLTYRFTVLFHYQIFHQLLMHKFGKVFILVVGHVSFAGLGYLFFCTLIMPEVCIFNDLDDSHNILGSSFSFSATTTKCD